MTESREFDPFDPGQRENPFEFFAWSRSEAPVTYAPGLGVWTVARYSDVAEILGDTGRFSSNPSLPHMYRDNPPEVVEILNRTKYGVSVVQADPPDHARKRAIWRKLMHGSRVNSCQPRMRETATELVDGFAADGHAELVGQFSQPYMARVLGAFVGIPEADTERIVDWNADFMTLMSFPAGVAEKKQAAVRFVECNEYLLELMDRRRAEPRDDLVSALVNWDEPLDDGDMLTILHDCFGAGLHTPRHSIGSAVLSMLTEREHWDRAATDPSTIPAVFEETLRRDAPHRGLMRVTTEETELGGVRLPAGALLLPLLGSANRDGGQFDGPDAFMPDRADVRKHLAFGSGIHTCVGAHLARTQGRIALTVLTERLPGMRLADSFVAAHYPNWFFWGLDRLDVVWDVEP